MKKTTIEFEAGYKYGLKKGRKPMKKWSLNDRIEIQYVGDHVSDKDKITNKDLINKMINKKTTKD